MVAPVTPIDKVIGTSTTATDVKNELDRNVRATGRYLVSQDIVINAQASPEGVPGVWIVSPLLLDDGRVLLVNRGWLPSTGPVVSTPPGAQPPTGRVTVTGLLSESESRLSGESADRGGRAQRTYLRIDVPVIQRQFSQRLVPGFLLRQSQRPPDPGKRPPQNLDRPVLTNGPHLSYTIQWFSFTALALVGYPLLLWLVARDREKKRGGGDGPDGGSDDLPPGAFVDDDGVLDLTDVDR